MAIRLATSTLSTPTKYTQEFNTFRGVDLTNSKMDVANYRATEMRNFIMENGTNTKRHAWEEIYKFPKDENDSKINGIWTLDTALPVIDNQGNITEYLKDSIVVIHYGKKFYKINNFGNEIDKTNILESYLQNQKDIEEIEFTSDKIKNEKSEAFVRGNKLYILCGEFLVLGKWKDSKGIWGNYQIKKVYDNEDTYIPTLVRNIVAENSDYLKSEQPIRTNIPFEDRNMLSSCVKVTLLGETESSSLQQGVEYKLNIGLKIMAIARISANGQLLSRSDYSFGGDKIKLHKNYVPTTQGEANIELTLLYFNQSRDLINNCKFGIVYGYNGYRDRLFLSGNEDYPNMLWHSTETNKDDESDFTYFSDLGYIKLGNTNNAIKGMYIQGDGSLVCLKTPSSQEPTIYFIKSTMMNATDYAGNMVDGLYKQTLEEVYPVQIGSIGVGLKKTNGIYNLNGDPLMIGEDGIYGIALGSNVASQQRYAKLRSRLVNTEIQSIKDLENTASIVYKNKLYFANSENGICYIADAMYPTKLEDELSDTFQYEWWVWDNINARLFFEYKENLYMATTSGQICKFKDIDYKDISFNEIKEGEITYDFYNNEFVLQEKNESINVEYKEQYEKIHNFDTISFTKKTNWKVLLESEENVYIDDNNNICISCDLDDKEKINYLRNLLYLFQTVGDYNGEYTIYLDNINSSLTNVATDTQYVLKYVREEEVVFDDGIIQINKLIFKFKIQEKSNNRTITLKQRTNAFRISFDLPNNLIIDNLRTEDGILFSKCVERNDAWYYFDENNELQLLSYSKPTFNRFDLISNETNWNKLVLIEYNTQIETTPENVDTNIAILTSNNPIMAYYITSWFNLGTDIYLKNLLNVYVVPDAIASNKVEFAFETRRKEASYISYTGREFDFNDLDFNNVSFVYNQIPSVYQKKFKTKKFSYIRFIFKNNDDNNCKLAKVTIEYTTSSKVKGEK